MEDTVPLTIRQLITNALELCTDADLLDLIYEMLVADSMQKAGH